MDSNNGNPPQPFSAPSQPYSQPPQIFGNYNSDGTAVTPTIPNDLFSDPAGFGFHEVFHDYDNHDHNDPKRRRIAKACDACRRKKVRCDAKPPKCTNCENYKTECVFTHVEKKRNPPKGAKYIEGLENRLGRMESLLRMSGLLSHDDPSATDLSILEKRLAQRNSSPLSSSSKMESDRATSNHGTPQQNNSDTPKSISNSPGKQKSGEDAHGQEPKQSQDVEELSDMMCSLMTNKYGETRFIGSSSGFSIFSPKGIQWVSEKTGDESFQQMISVAAVADNKWFHWKPEVFDDVFARRVFQPLPPKDECFSLIRTFFDAFNKMFPLYHEPTFWWLTEKQYSDDPYNGSGWWASLNLAIAMAYRIRVVRTLDHSGHADDNAWLYFKNAMSVHSELSIRNTDLFSVQALLGMALFMQGTPNPQPSFNLAGLAIRLAHSIGLHKKAPGFGLNRTEIEQRKRVFWIAYLIDKDISLRSGRPPMQDDNDWNVDLPSEEPDDGVGVVPTKDGDKVNLFRKIAEFSVISGKVYARLYSVKAAKQSDGELLNTIGELDSELEEWKDSIPLQFRPEHEPDTGDQSLTLQLVTLHFAYYNCLATVHRRSIHHGYWTDRLSDYASQGLNIHSLNPRVYSSALLCVQAARASINLIKYIPQGDYACVWLILYYPVSSLVTLFANILQNPQDPRARADLKLMGVVVNFLSHICVNEGTGNLQRMHVVCSEFERIAKVVLDRADREMTARQKRKQEREKEKVEIGPFPLGQKQPTQSASNSPNDSATIGSNDDTHARLNGAAPNGMFDLGTFGQQQAPEALLTNTGIDLNAPWSNEATQPMNGVTDGLAQSSSPSFPFTGGAGDAPQMSNGPFQQPFVPPDLWSLPMTFEWDWQDIVNQMPLDDIGAGTAGSKPAGT